MTSGGHQYKSITVTTKNGKQYTTDYCDYYIQDGILTVILREKCKDYNSTYYPVEKHYPMDNLEEIMCKKP